MTLPSILLGAIISSVYGALFHLLRGGNLGRLILYLLLAWVGFWVGHFFGAWLNWNFLAVGDLNVGMGTVISLVILGAGYWLSLVQVERK